MQVQESSSNGVHSSTLMNACPFVLTTQNRRGKIPEYELEKFIRQVQDVPPFSRRHVRITALCFLAIRTRYVKPYVMSSWLHVLQTPGLEV